MKSFGFRTHEWSQKRKIPSDFFPSVDSTSNYAKSLMNDPLENHHNLHLVIADSQTAGRGRGTNTWLNTDVGTSLLCTWSFRLTRAPQPVTSARIGLSLYNAATKVWPKAPFALKAPNDLFLEDKKTAGLLLEVIDQGPHIRLLIGLGLNVTAAPGLDTSTCLSHFIDVQTLEDNWSFFLEELYKEFQTACDQLSSELSSFDCERLLAALNNSSLIKDKYTHVDSDGSLWIGKKKIHWSDL